MDNIRNKLRSKVKMGLFSKNKSRDVIFLIPVNTPDEKLPRGKMRMLYCDAMGRVYTTLLDKTVYKLICEDIEKFEANNRCYATVGLELSTGTFAPVVVEISSDESWTLSHALEHALNNGIIPEILLKNIAHVIKLGDTGYQKNNSNGNGNNKTGKSPIPRILDRLPYYLERDMEFSMPVYKAEHPYPLIILKSYSSGGSSSGNGQKLLVLDSDGDLAIIKIPFKILDKAEKRLQHWAGKNSRDACLIIYHEEKGYSIDFIVISPAQRKALDVMVREYEETGSGRGSLSVAAQRVVSRAQELASCLID
ncbi:MAG TPA: hypothetical protein G4O15_00085 [Dehalococcoidia bacterium]|nr:hypothetical protein [Dehalococcoidia bacterium]